MTRRACANSFSSVGGGVNGRSAKLEVGAIFWVGSRDLRAENIAVCRTTSRRRTSAVVTLKFVKDDIPDLVQCQRGLPCSQLNRPSTSIFMASSLMQRKRLMMRTGGVDEGHRKGRREEGQCQE